jgi:hypothetical protein
MRFKLIASVVIGIDCIGSSESEELNRALVLTLARAVHVNGKEMKQH